MAVRAETLSSHARREWSRTWWAGILRALVQTLVLVPVVRWSCRALRVEGRDELPSGPAVYVANHASHADAAAIIASLPWRVRRRLAPAAAEDYFFGSRSKGAAVRLAIGAFPFPRRGSDGLGRARRLLAQGWSVLLFPEGTRSRDGSIASFKRGIGVLARLGHPVVPVGVAGTGEVLPPKSRVPRIRPVSIVFGEADHHDGAASPEGAAAVIESSVRALAFEAARLRPQARVTWYRRVRRLAIARVGVALAFAWGVAEAIVWPVVPDAFVALLAVAAPRRAFLLAVAAATGSVVGGAGAYVLGAIAGSGLLEHLPLVTPRMIEAVSSWYATEGTAALGHQPLSGVPFKVFGVQAAGHGIDIAGFVWGTAVARAPRILLVGAGFGVFGVLTRRWLPRLYGAFVVVFCAGFALGLARVVATWR